MSKIEWTDETWNPVTGCNKVSEGCAHCYAEGVAKRFWGDRKFSEVQFHPERLEQPLQWKKPRMVFVNSMSDLFHESVTDEQLDQIFAVMAMTPQHTYQVLTKRPKRMLPYLSKTRGENNVLLRVLNAARDLKQKNPKASVAGDLGWPYENIWLGVTVENQKAANERIPLLLETPAAVRFLSCEPLLEGIDLSGLLSGIDWVIVGGESGHKARPFDIRWARSIISQCRDAGVSVFVKQLGTRNNWTMNKMGASTKGSNPDEWPEDLRVREYPNIKVAAIA